MPVCAADLQRIRDGVDPEPRRVPVGGEMVPYWQAGAAYMPWAGGFFGGGLLPGLFIGSVLSGGIGSTHPPRTRPETSADFGGGGDFGGGTSAAATSAAAGTSAAAA